MTTEASEAGTALAADLQTLARLEAASDAAGQVMAVGIGAMLLIVLIFLAQGALGRQPLVRRGMTHRTVLAVIGPALAAPVIALLAADVIQDARTPAGTDRASLCDRLYPALAARTPAPEAVERVLQSCPDHRGALRALLIAGPRPSGAVPR